MGPEVKQHSKSIHRGVCPAKDIPATELLTSHIAQDKKKKVENKQMPVSEGFPHA